MYSAIVVPSVLEKLPHALQLTLTRGKEHQRWNLNNLLQAMGGEIKLREEYNDNTHHRDFRKHHAARLFQGLINTIMPQDDVEEGCSGTEGPDKEAYRDSVQEVTLPVDSKSDLLAEEDCSGTTGQHKEVESKQEDIPPSDGSIDLSDPS